MQEGVSHHNRDILSKYFAQSMAGKSLAVYGIQIPRISRPLNVELPEVLARDQFADNIYLLEDASICVLDNESKYDRYNKIKYLRYVTQILTYYAGMKADDRLSSEAQEHLNQLRKKWKGRIPSKVRIIVVYTGDVKRGRTKPVLDIGGIRLETEEAFLSDLPKDEIVETIEKKVFAGEVLNEEELMKYIIVPLSAPSSKEKRILGKRMLALTDKIKDDDQRKFLLSGMAIWGNKVFTDEMITMIRRRIAMTRVGMLFEKEKEEAVNAAIAEKEREKNEEIKALSEEMKQMEKNNTIMIEKLKQEIIRLGGSTAML
ncbi:MAG: hypothetical protein K6E84_01925 [Lachnospiraceae bacterium]|nr:hypothetical protein [Lachnospiraceae bacterium]